MTVRLLLDNGSSRADSTRSLRRIAATLEPRLDGPVHPVSLKHSDKVQEALLDGRPADTLAPWLDRALSRGERDFRILPLYFGPSAALTREVPAIVAAAASKHGRFDLRLAPELCPLPAGEPLLADIVAEQAQSAAAKAGCTADRVVLVDHGSPLEQVGAVRSWLAESLRERLGPRAQIWEAAMERRPGPEFDFNGELLESLIARLARERPGEPLVLALLFVAAGRHAGRDGDIAAICDRIADRVPASRIVRSGLVGEHPKLVDILVERARQADRALPLDSENPR